MKIKKTIGIVLSLLMVLTMIPILPIAAAELPFSDVQESDWFYDSVMYVNENGIMKGMSDDTFEPQTTMSRAMIVTVLHRIEGEPTAFPSSFLDVPGDTWFTNPVAWAAADGIVNGYDANTFGPNDNVSREQIATILFRYAEKKGYDVSKRGDLKDYFDNDDISDWAENALAWANAEELIKGYPDNTIIPGGNATRSEVATILMRFCEKFGEPSDTPEPPIEKTYTVTFDLNYDNKGTFKTVEVKEGETVGTIENPSRAGYSFMGWFTEKTNGEKYDIGKTTVTQDVTLYARWKKNSTGGSGTTPSIHTYTVKFDSNGGSAVDSQKVKENEKAKEPIAPTKEKYVFKGWYSDKELKTAYSFDTAVTKNLTLYAKWEEKPPVVYTITFESNGGSAVEAQKVSGKTTVTKPADPEKEGYAFAGWFVDKELSTEYDFNVTVTAALTLYAKWEENQSGTVDLGSANVGDYVTFGLYEQDDNLDNGKEAIEWKVLDKTDGRVLLLSKYGLDCKTYNEELTDVTWETCTLRNWLNSSFLNEAFSTSEQSAIPTVTLSNPNNPNYGTEGGNDTNDQVFLLSLEEMQQYFNLSDTWTDYDGNEWDVTGDDGSIGGSKDVITSPTAYAVAQGAYTDSHYHDAKGKEACWWWLRSRNGAAGVFGDGSVYAYGRIVSGACGAVRPALWVNLTSSGDGGTVTTTYTVTFDSNGGSVVDSQKVKENQKATEPAEPTKDGSTFSGWYSDNELNTEYDFNNSVSSDLTLYAKWKNNEESGVIQDSWEEIIASINDGTYKNKYKIGDTKSLDLGSEGVVDMQIAAFDADELADGSGKAAITWISKQLLNSRHQMNQTREADPSDSSKYTQGTGSVGGWEYSEMRAWLNLDVKPLIPDTVRNEIKPVKKYSTSFDTSLRWIQNQVSTDEVWIPSIREVYGEGLFDNYETEGPVYTDLFTSQSDRIKSKENSNIWWWLRSANYYYFGDDGTGFEEISPWGSTDFNSGGATGEDGVALGFCM